MRTHRDGDRAVDARGESEGTVRAFAWRICATAALWLASPAAAQQSKIVPGLMGPNALPTIPVEDAEIPSQVTTEVAAATHFTGRGTADRAYAPQFQVVVPFLGSAALEVLGTPLEVWSVSPSTRDRFGGHSLSGVSKGDIDFGARFNFFGESARRPSFTLRLLTKSTTGKDLFERRFTDAPGYAVELLASKTLATSGGRVRRVRVLAKLGFLSWSQEQGLQDDAINYGFAVDTRFARGTELRVELRGYQGYQVHDKPMLASLRVLQPLGSRLAVFTGLNRGLRADAPEWELRGGLRLGLDSPFSGR